MKPLILLFLLLMGSLSIAQTPEEKENKFKKHIYFNLNLDDHTNDQLLHVDINPVLPYMINIKLDGSNFLGIGRYTIKKMDFKVCKVPENNLEKPIETSKTLHIKDIKFWCFTKKGGKCSETQDSLPLPGLSVEQSRNNSKEKRVVHFKVDLTTKKPDNEFEPVNNMNFSVFDNSIFDMHIKIDGKDPTKFLSDLAPGILNFGGHICKVRINY